MTWKLLEKQSLNGKMEMELGEFLQKVLKTYRYCAKSWRDRDRRHISTTNEFTALWGARSPQILSICYIETGIGLSTQCLAGSGGEAQDLKKGKGKLPLRSSRNSG